MYRNSLFQSCTANGARLYSQRHELTVRLNESPPLAMLHVGGFFFGDDALRLRQTIEACAKRGTSVMLFDLSRLSFIDTAGVGALAQLEAEAEGQGILCAFVRPARPLVNQAIEVCGAPRRRETHDDAELALESLARRIGSTLPMLGMLETLVNSAAQSAPPQAAQPVAETCAAAHSVPHPEGATVSKETYEASLRRIDELEKRLAELESGPRAPIHA